MADRYERIRAALAIEFGALAPPLSEQLAALGIDDETIEHWQRDADAISRLSIRDVLTTREARVARERLWKRMRRVIQDATRPTHGGSDADE